MRAAIVFALAFAGFAVADTWTVEDTCDAAVVVKNCLASQGARIATCTANDWGCLCQEYQSLAGCYINCPKDKNLAAVQSSVTAYCNAASATNTATTTTKPVSGTSTGTTTAAAGSSGPNTTARGDSASSTLTSSAPGASGSSGAAFAAAPAGMFGVLPGVLALAGAFL